MKYLSFVLLVLIYIPAHASDARLSELRWVDTGFLERQRALIDDMVRSQYGAILRQDKSDLRLLARIINDELINRTEIQKLQAMGVVLGDIYVNELSVNWMVYEDEVGKSRAVCVPDTHHCLFPITTISKRAQLGAKPDVNALYERGVELLQPYLPKTPYSSHND